MKIRLRVPLEIIIVFVVFMAIIAFSTAGYMKSGCLYGPFEPHWFNICLPNLAR